MKSNLLFKLLLGASVVLLTSSAIHAQHVISSGTGPYKIDPVRRTAYIMEYNQGNKDHGEFIANSQWVNNDWGMSFFTNYRERLRITNNGNVGIGMSNGNTAPGYKLQVWGDIYADGGWLRVSGQRGLYFQSYGGGFYMTDDTWIRTYNDKNFYHNTGIMRTDGALQVGGNGSRFHVETGGDVGIGVSNPSSKLHVDGNVSLQAGNGKGFRFWNSDNYKIHMGNSDEYKYGPVTDYSIKMNMNNQANRGWTWGAVGQTPIAALNTQGHMKIAGNLTASNVIVGVSSFPDYVFADDYKLLSLKEVDQYIQKHKHLPNVPAAAEIEKEGMDVGKLNVLLVEKVEELTLYTIQQEKRIQQLEERLKALENN
ncbi:MAG: shufflon system plasmid conjugative transfer pilus tip adhesin PilV [Flammeovirgaceae bacterium]